MKAKNTSVESATAYASLERDLDEHAAELKAIFVVTPFPDSAPIHVMRLAELEKATERLIASIQKLVPTTAWKHDNWNSSLAHELALTYQGAGLLQSGQDNGGNSPAANLLKQLTTFNEMLSLTKKRIKPSKGQSRFNRPEGIVSNILAGYFVERYFEAFGDLPPTTQEGWAVVTLESILEKHQLGKGARQLLRKYASEKKASNS